MQSWNAQGTAINVDIKKLWLGSFVKTSIESSFRLRFSHGNGVTDYAYERVDRQIEVNLQVGTSYIQFLCRLHQQLEALQNFMDASDAWHPLLRYGPKLVLEFSDPSFSISGASSSTSGATYILE